MHKLEISTSSVAASQYACEVEADAHDFDVKLVRGGLEGRCLSSERIRLGFTLLMPNLLLMNDLALHVSAVGAPPSEIPLPVTKVTYLDTDVMRA